MDAEIAIYRKMLEGEGDGPGLKQLVEQVVRTTGINEIADTGLFLALLIQSFIA